MGGAFCSPWLQKMLFGCTGASFYVYIKDTGRHRTLLPSWQGSPPRICWHLDSPRNIGESERPVCRRTPHLAGCECNEEDSATADLRNLKQMSSRFVVRRKSNHTGYLPLLAPVGRRGGRDRITQVLTGHDCFGEYLCRIGKEATAQCFASPTRIPPLKCIVHGTSMGWSRWW